MQKFICSLSWTYTPLVLLCSGLKSKSNFWRKQLLRSLVLKQSSQLFASCHHETKESLNGKGISEKQNQILKKNILLLKISKNSGKVNTIAKKNMINCWGENCSMDFFKGKKEKKIHSYWSLPNQTEKQSYSVLCKNAASETKKIKEWRQ